jgi:hypothetical protein
MKVEKMTVNRVEYSELEAHIRQVYGIDDPKQSFSIVAMEEWRNDSAHSFSLEAESLSEYDAKALAKWKADPCGYHLYMLRPILIDMVNNGTLELGNYLITVCW